MSVVVVGVNHHTVPVEVLERFTLAPADVGKTILDLVQRDNIREAAVVSTCARTELYLVAEKFHGAIADATDVLAAMSGLGLDELTPHLVALHDADAATHLFEVAAGLDSAVLGETEILGQVRTSWRLAQQNDGLKSTLDLLFRRAMRVGKRARSETAIARGTASMSHAAVEMAIERLGTIDGASVLVLGAGDMGRGVATSLRAAGAGAITVANRTAAHGAALATAVAGTAIGISSRHQLFHAIATADVMVTCASGELLVTSELVAERSRPLLVVDIAVPRNVDHAVGELANVTLLDVDDLGDWAARGLAKRAADTDRVRAIVADELELFLTDVTARQAAPLVAALHDRAESIRSHEVARYASRFSELDESQRDAVEALTRAIVAKLLHSPSVRLRTAAGTPQGERNAAAVTDLFELDA